MVEGDGARPVGDLDTMTGPEAAQRLRMLVGELWSAVGDRRQGDGGTVLHRLSQEVERLARHLEVPQG